MTAQIGGCEPKCELFAILAREASVGVIFRRGPSRQVLLVRWDLADDTFEEGQWLKGRIYERRCDLSPRGDKLLYFAAKYETPMRTWTAISRPPWLTAIALWPKGDAWGGGGLFEGERSILLNSPATPISPGPGASPPIGVKVREMGLGGEDFPLYEARLRRDGWERVSEGVAHERRYLTASPWILFDPAIEHRRSSPVDLERALHQRIVGIKEKQGVWWVVEHEVRARGEVELALGRTSWADWDRNGDLVFARGGAVHRLRRGAPEPAQLVDLSDRRFVARRAPESASRW